MKPKLPYNRKDLMSEELAIVLLQKSSWDFGSLFDIVYGNLRAKGSATQNQDMLRLLLHEKLQRFLVKGMVKKAGTEYTGVPFALVNYQKAEAELKARMAEVKQNRTALEAKAPSTTTIEESE